MDVESDEFWNAGGIFEAEFVDPLGRSYKTELVLGLSFVLIHMNASV